MISISQARAARANHSDSCCSYTCYTRYVELQDSAQFEGYHEWKRSAGNTCVAGQNHGKELCGDLDRVYGMHGRLSY